MRRVMATFMVVMMVLGVVAAPAAADHYVWSSTNAENMATGAPHVYLADEGPGWITLAFYDQGQGSAKFEILPDGNDDHRRKADGTCKNLHGIPELAEHGECQQTGWNVEPANGDGLYTEWGTFAYDDGWLNAEDTIQVRKAGGGERDTDFPYVTFEVPPIPESKADCQNAEYANPGLYNQGQCIKFLNTGDDGRP